MSERAHHVLFLCTGNSARSILAEALLERMGPPRYRGFSAGSHPKARPHSMAVETLAAHGHDTARLRSKSWDEFAKPDAPEIDVIITVCDNAAGESCPIWPGRPLTAHWSLEDPAAVEGTRDRCRAAFEKTYELLAARIEALTRIDPEAADRSSRIAELASVGAPLIASKG